MAWSVGTSPGWADELLVISCSRGSHMEIWRIVSYGLVSGSLVFGVWVLPAEYENWIFLEMTFLTCTMLGSTVNT